MPGIRPTAGGRLTEIDVLRGLAIVLMALDHARDYFFEGGFRVNPLDPAQTTVWLYVTRWVTHLCAPTFVLLAGVSIHLQRFRGKTTERLSGFLLVRGLWLIALELTVLSFGWSFAMPYLLFMQVIWAIGWCMIAMAALVWLPRWLVLAVGIVIVGGHNLLDSITSEQFGNLGILWKLLHEGGLLSDERGPHALIAYAVLPWIGIMALGYGLGGLFNDARPGRDRRIFLLGVAMLVAFVALRGFDGYGNPAMPANLGQYGDVANWHAQPDARGTLMAFFNVQKYPPSLQFALVTLGLVFALWPLLARLRGPVAGFLATFGAVPLFFYVLHVYALHLLAVAANAAAGRDVSGLFDFMRNGFMGSPLLEGLGFSLPGVYLAWAAVLALLYFPCRWWMRLKAQRRDWWLSYL